MIFSQSDGADIYRLIVWTKQQWGSWLAGFIRSQLIWINTVFKGGFRIVKKLGQILCFILETHKQQTQTQVKLHNSLFNSVKYLVPTR